MIYCTCKKKVFLYSLGALLAAFLVTSTAEAAPVSHETVLSGEVVSVVSVGTSVKEGDPLLTVQTLGGPMVASRATVNGVVQTVSVEPGATVERGQIITVINN